MKLKNNGPIKAPVGFVLTIVERPQSWFPDSPTAIPPTAKIVERITAPSFDAAYSDMIQCNREAMKNNGNRWAMVHRANQN